MPSVLENVAVTPNGEMPNGTHKEVMQPPADVDEEDCPEPDGEVGEDEGDSDPASEEPVTVVETEEYKAGSRYSSHV